MNALHKQINIMFNYWNGNLLLKVIIYQVLNYPVTVLCKISGNMYIGTHRTPHGDAVFLRVQEVVGLKRVPQCEDNRRAVGPLEIHLHGGIMQSDPQLFNIW